MTKSAVKIPHSCSQSGFTLMELGVALIIIGLITGGILKAQEILQTARLVATVQQVSTYRAAFRSFQNIYSYMPGDLPNAANILPNCGAEGHCSGVTAPLVDSTADFTIGTSGYPNYVGGANSENRIFWTHLSRANMITGINPEADDVSLRWGAQYPANKLGGGFHVLAANIVASPTIQEMRGLYLLLRANAGAFSASEATAAGGGAAVTPNQALQLDQKMDDGLPRTGTVVSVPIGAPPGCVGTYNINIGQSNCNLLIKLR